MSDNVLYLGSELESAYKQIGSQMRDFVELQRDMAAPEFDKADAEENATIQKRMQSLDEKFKVLLDKHAKTERKNESLSTKIIDDGLIWWNFDVPLYIGGLAVLCLAFDILYLPN